METNPSTPVPAEQTCYRHTDRRAGVRCQRCERLICPSCMSSASVGFHCPECVKGGSQKVYTRSSLARLNRPIATQILIGINLAVFLVGFGRSGIEVDFGLVGQGATEDGLVGVAQGEWYRVVTAGFLHANIVHLLFNMMALYSLGPALERLLGRARFVTLYFTSMLFGSAGVLILDPDALTVGASGAVFGLLGAMVIAQRQAGIDPWASGLGLIIGINLLFTFSVPGISIGGHVGGLLGGLVAGWLMLDVGPRVLGSETAATVAVAALGGVAFATCLLVV